MKYIYLLIFSLFEIHNFSLANENIDNLCEEFLISPKYKTTDTINNENILFKTGVLWKVITPKNATNYLYGTIHSQEYSVSNIPYEVRVNLIKSKKLILEVIPDENANISYKNSIYHDNGKNIDELLGKPFYEKLMNQIKHYDLNDMELNRIKYMKPWAVFNLIGRPKTVRAPSLESNLLKFAQEKIIEIDSLETMDEILSSLDQLSINDQLIILKDTICNRKNIMKEIKELVDLYIRRDALGILEITSNKRLNDETYERYIKTMLHDRNEKMLKKIIEEFNYGSTFVAVGISHLIAKNGILESLQDLDYSIEVIY